MVFGRPVISKGMFALWGAGFALLPGVASAAAAAWPDIEACRRLADDRARLACYDRALPPAVDVAAQGKATSPSTPSAPQPMPAPTPQVAVPVVANASSARPAAATMPGPAGLTSPATPGVARGSQGQAGKAQQGQAGVPVTANFGLPQKPAFDRGEVLETSIAGNFDGWGPDEKITLTNGQVWQINDGSSAGYSLRDPRVRITRGSFGGFFMQVEGVSQTPRAKRVR